MASLRIPVKIKGHHNEGLVVIDAVLLVQSATPDISDLPKFVEAVCGMDWSSATIEIRGASGN